MDNPGDNLLLSAVPARTDAVSACPAWLAGVVLVCLTLAAYYPTVHAGYIWDDNDHLTANPLLHDAAGLAQCWRDPGGGPVPLPYFPVTLTLSWLEYQVVGTAHPGALHLFDAGLHALNALLVWRLLRRLQVPWAWLAAGIFALHPMQVETVAWIAEQKNLLSCLFGVLAVQCYLNFTAFQGRAVPRWGWYAVALLLFVLALLSKISVAGLPLVIGLIIYWKRGRVTRDDLRPVVPWLVLAAGISWLVASRSNPSADGYDLVLTGLQRLVLACRALAFYAGKFLWPTRLLLIYPRWAVGPAGWEYLFPAGVLAGFGGLWLGRRRLGCGLLAGVLSGVVLVGPALGFVNFAFMHFSFVADHFMYLAMVPAAALLAAGLHALSCRCGAAGAGDGWLRTGVPAGGLLLIGLAVLTWRQARLYENNEGLWSYVVEHNPDWKPRANLAEAHYNAGHWQAALRQADASLAIAACYSAYAIRGFVFEYNLHQPATAAEALGHAVHCDDVQADAYLELGRCQEQLGDYDAALAAYKQAVALDPSTYQAWNNLAVCYLRAGPHDPQAWTLAAAAARQALHYYETYANAHCNLAIALQQQGDSAGAIAHYQRCLALAPDNPAVQAQLAKLLAAPKRP